VLQTASDAAKDQDLLSQPLSVINIGLAGFAAELETHNVEVTNIDWVPPAGGDPEMADLLSRLGA